MQDATWQQLKLAGVHKVEVARELCGNSPAKPAVAAYLAHVGLECLLKSWLLTKYNCRNISHYLRSKKSTDNKVFSGSQGHNLEILARETALSRFLTAEKKSPLLTSNGWRGLISSNRPYDVRYGSTALSITDARAEVDVAHAIYLLIKNKIQ